MQRNGIDAELWDEVTREVVANPDEAKVVVKTHHRWDRGFAIEGQMSAIESAGEVLYSQTPIQDRLARGSGRPEHRTDAR